MMTKKQLTNTQYIVTLLEQELAGMVEANVAPKDRAALENNIENLKTIIRILSR